LTASPAVVDDSIKYVDGQVSLSMTRHWLDLGALVGTRFGDQLTSLGGTSRSWGNLSAVAWMTERIALAASAGTFPIDPTQGFPGGRFASVSIRIATQRAREAILSSTQQPQAGLVAEEAMPVATSFSAERTPAGMVVVRVAAPLARLVEINGDFTNWTPLELTRASDGSWFALLPISPGNYQMNLRLDGGKWVVPPGLLSMLDEFGGSVGLLVIEAKSKM
jgi:hypothetical protein